MSENFSNTQYFKATTDENSLEVSQILERVYKALVEKGYNPVNQIVGYIMSGDPTYITSYNSARSLIMRAERDELIEEALTYYINSKFAGKKE
ncbi:MAG: IreB family regulatory phosphoprotein [Lachnospiraceae bacterium]|nr:IreB family regulatory phosphoprotein [Lachnospiraceae bacterium]